MLRPVDGICAVPGCAQDMESIPLRNLARWKHAFHCREEHHSKQSPFVQFCSICNRWVKGESEWTMHCQDHIANQQSPFRCDPIILRNAIACPGYCHVHLGSHEYSANHRLQQFWDQSGRQRHASVCVSAFIKSQFNHSQLQCPHPECPVVSTSPEDLWLHLADIHSTSGKPIKKHKTLDEDGLSGDTMSPPFERHCAQSSIDRQVKPVLYGSCSHLTFVNWVSSESLPISGGLVKDDFSSLSELTENEKIGHENDGGSRSDVQSSPSSTSFPYMLSSTQGNDKSLHPHLRSNPAISSGQDKEAGQQPPQDITALSGTHDVATSSSTGIESVPQRGGTSYPSLLSPYSIDDMADSKHLSSNEASGLLQPASIVKADTSRAQLDESNDDNFGNAYEASKRLQFILSTSENSDIIDPQLYIDQNSEEDLGTKDGYASSSRQNGVSASEMGQPTALDPDGAVWEVDELLAKWKQERLILHLMKWKGFLDDANA
ncbi:hypothetical protein QL093DRAFT_2565615 [Fusarium oxysporum]|nr:hypothetical protein QL093DRAFT_2565615 [Fusarium oxysporum]